MIYGKTCNLAIKLRSIRPHTSECRPTDDKIEEGTTGTTSGQSPQLPRSVDSIPLAWDGVTVHKTFLQSIKGVWSVKTVGYRPVLKLFSTYPSGQTPWNCKIWVPDSINQLNPSPPKDTELAKRAGPRLRDQKEEGTTQPRAHSFDLQFDHFQETLASTKVENLLPS